MITTSQVVLIEQIHQQLEEMGYADPPPPAFTTATPTVVSEK
jgi:hypothetical protein